MAKSTKNMSKKVHKMVRSDAFTSVAIVSILLNILFLVTIFVLSSTDSFGRGVYNTVRDRYCNNIDGVVERAEALGDEATAVREWQVTCVSDEFKPYYNEALKKFEASSNN